MFKRGCDACGEYWYIGNDSTCKCPDETPKKEWVGLTDEEIEKIVDMNTSDDGGFDIFCDGHSIASAVMDKLKERNNG